MSHTRHGNWYLEVGELRILPQRQADPLCGERAQIPAAIPARIPPHPGILQKAQGSEFAPTHAGAGRYWCWGTLSAGGILGRGSCTPQDMSATVLEELVGSDALEPIYSHLLSLGNFARIRDRLTEAPPAHNTG